MNAYVEEINEPEKVHTSNKRLCVMLDAKYKEAYLNKVQKNQRKHLKEPQHNKLLRVLQKPKNCKMEH